MDPLRIALLASHRAAGLDHLLADPNRGSTWELSIVVSSEPKLEEEDVLARAGVPLEIRPIRMVPSFRNLRAREDYDDQLADLLERMRIDYILLSGYEYILTSGLVERFAGKILALHDADLTLRDAGRLYAGPHAVREAIFAGEPETRSTIYLVTNEVATGPLFLISGAFPLASMACDARERGDAAFLAAYADLHRRWMIGACWGEMLTRALELLAGGTLTVVGDVVWVDGAPGPCRFGESPRACHEPEAMVARGIPRSCPFIG